MSFVSVNLLSPARLLRARRRHALQRWGFVVAGYGVLALLVGLALSARPPQEARAAQELDALRSLAGVQAQQLHAAREQLHVLRTQVEAARAVGDHPNWSHLIRAVAQRTGAAVELRAVRIAYDVRTFPQAAASAPAGTPNQAGAPALRERRHLDVELEGLAPGIAQAQDFVVELETMGFFDSVRLEGDASTGGGGGYEFRVIGQLRQEAATLGGGR